MMINTTTRATQRRRTEVPIWQKELLTLEEAAEYTGLGLQKLRDISNDEHCDFVLWNASKRMFKRRKLETYLDAAYSI
ncbi:MAG: transposase [Lachnospiraceae bacterium]|nr:transposase [Lachnospiraceae bacterium]